MQLNHQIKQYERKGDDLIPDETFANRLLILEQNYKPPQMAGKGRGQDGTEVVETLCSRRQPYLVKWKLNQPVMT